MTCYNPIEFRDYRQEVYETASKDAVGRSRELRRVGYKVRCSSLGSQVTRAGVVRLTLLRVYRDSNGGLPPLPPFPEVI